MNRAKDRCSRLGRAAGFLLLALPARGREAAQEVEGFSEVRLRNDFMIWDAGHLASIEFPDGPLASVCRYASLGQCFTGGTTGRTPAPSLSP